MNVSVFVKMTERKNEAHKAFIRTLPCATCGRGPAEAAHVRLSYFGDITAPDGERGYTSLKSADKWCLPLCPWCHRLNSDSQHNMGERPFWERHGINPLALAASLWANTGNLEACRGIVGRARLGVTL